MRRGQYREGVKAGGNRTVIKTGVKGMEHTGAHRGRLTHTGAHREGIIIYRGS